MRAASSLQRHAGVILPRILWLLLRHNFSTVLSNSLPPRPSRCEPRQVGDLDGGRWRLVAVVLFCKEDVLRLDVAAEDVAGVVVRHDQQQHAENARSVVLAKARWRHPAEDPVAPALPQLLRKLVKHPLVAAITM